MDKLSSSFSKISGENEKLSGEEISVLKKLA
jgi:hypothetical protein